MSETSRLKVKGDRFMKRSRDVIISQILDICAKGASKTRIVYQANLNFRTINPYLDLLTKNGLINVKKEQTLIYETTPRGLDLLDNFKQIQNELSSP
jgi:predicted transcriptional regulator